VAAPTQNLPQLYRFCFLMTGDEQRAQAAFQDTIREAASHFAEGEPPNDRLWFFREARWRCLAAAEHGIQPEDVEMDETSVALEAPEQVRQLEPQQLAIWISGAPDPQRSVLALFYLDEFTHREICSLLELSVTELGRLLAQGRGQFQTWLDAHTILSDEMA
jgi:DNA-directed RNA polymerase specialized sigma24 family protein